MQCVKVKLLHAIQSSAFTKKSTSLKEVDLVHKLACFFSPYFNSKENWIEHSWRTFMSLVSLKVS